MCLGLENTKNCVTLIQSVTYAFGTLLAGASGTLFLIEHSLSVFNYYIKHA